MSVSQPARKLTVYGKNPIGSEIVSLANYKGWKTALLRYYGLGRGRPVRLDDCSNNVTELEPRFPSLLAAN
jgi:hypothetical protein